MRAEEETIIQGSIETIVYHSEETSYAVFRIQPDDARNPLIVVGFLAHIQEGQTVRCNGRWKTHDKYGQQFAATTIQVVLPATLLGIKNYLGSGLIRGIGPGMAARLVNHFGVETLEIIERDPSCWQQNRLFRESSWTV